MKNRINQIIYLDDNSSYIILDQVIYKGKNYYLVCKIDDNKELTDVFTILEENIDNDNITIETIKDSNLLKKLIEYFNKRSINY